LKKHANLALLIAGLGVAGVQPALGVSKEILQIMQQLDTLQQAVQNLQRTVDTERGELRALIEQANNNVTAMKSIVADLQKATEQSLASNNARLDSSTSQVQALSESLEEVKARLAKLSDQMTQTQNIIQTLNIQNAAAANPPPGSAAGGDPKAANRAPDADTLYKSGLSYYNGGQYQLAVQAFQQYLQYYGDTDLASNAQFYIGDCYYNQANYAQAIEEYNKCVERYPQGNKLPAAQLKKGYALLELGQTHAGVRELRSLVERYPSSHEADLARQRLKKLGITLPKGRGGA
jgi:tol-pal system protein YbgF